MNIPITESAVSSALRKLCATYGADRVRDYLRYYKGCAGISEEQIINWAFAGQCLPSSYFDVLCRALPKVERKLRHNL